MLWLSNTAKMPVFFDNLMYHLPGLQKAIRPASQFLSQLSGPEKSSILFRSV